MKTRPPITDRRSAEIQIRKARSARELKDAGKLQAAKVEKSGKLLFCKPEPSAREGRSAFHLVARPLDVPVLEGGPAQEGVGDE